MTTTAAASRRPDHSRRLAPSPRPDPSRRPAATRGSHAAPPPRPSPAPEGATARLPALLHADPVSRHTRIVLWVLAGLLVIAEVAGYVFEPWFTEWLAADPQVRAEVEAAGEDPFAMGPRSGLGLVLRVGAAVISVLGTVLFAWQPSVAAVAVLSGSILALPGLVGPDAEHLTPQLFSGGVVLGAALVTRYSRVAFVWTCLGVLVAFTVAAELLVDPDTPAATGEQFTYLITAVMGVCLAIPAWLVRRSRHRARDRMAALDAARRIAEEAAGAERQRIAAELHDVVAHGLTVISMQAAMLPTLTDPQRRRAAEDAIETAARQSLVDLRRMLTALRGTAQNQDTADGDDAADLAERLTEFRRRLGGAGYRVVGELGGLADLPRSMTLTVLRVAQETTTNVLKHGPGTGTVSMTSHLDDAGHLVLRVASPLARRAAPREPGRRAPAAGPPAWPTSGFGLAGMRERVSVFGGTLHAGPCTDRWVVEAVLPTR